MAEYIVKTSNRSLEAWKKERMQNCDAMDDPLKLHDAPDANAVRLARAAPHPAIEQLYARLTGGQHPDSVEVRVLLLAHLVYLAYRDIKESIAL